MVRVIGVPVAHSEAIEEGTGGRFKVPGSEGVAREIHGHGWGRRIKRNPRVSRKAAARRGAGSNSPVS